MLTYDTVWLLGLRGKGGKQLRFPRKRRREEPFVIHQGNLLLSNWQSSTQNAVNLQASAQRLGEQLAANKNAINSAKHFDRIWLAPQSSYTEVAETFLLSPGIAARQCQLALRWGLIRRRGWPLIAFASCFLPFTDSRMEKHSSQAQSFYCEVLTNEEESCWVCQWNPH